ncbi:MAG: energy-coupling factor ABC transporter permease [Acidimicrobiia bacterium]|jgi:cobalt/nickel transport system permease protein|nr:cobalt ABC transporter permease [Acidimicrobiia bacterium]
MHVPDGFINAATSVGTGVVAAGGLGVSLRNAARGLRDFHIPLAGVTAALIFALQMLNFPVLPGVSGHLMGGALAAILLGPWMGAVVVSVVVIVQALFFADGGISALGVNVTNIALVTAFVAWPVFRGVLKILPKTRLSAMAAAMVSAFVSVLAGSFAFVLEYALGGVGGAPIGTVLGAMTGIHALIGVGEGLITATALGTVLAVRPDLVRGAADVELSGTDTVPTGRAVTTFVLTGLAVAVALVVFVAPFASPHPDGLETVAEQTGFASAAQEHPIGGPLADYQVAGVESETVGTIVSGIIGTVIAFAIGLGIVAVSRRRARSA